MTISEDYRVLAEEICRLASNLPAELVEKLVNILLETDPADRSYLHSRLKNASAKVHARKQIGNFLNVWGEKAAQVSADSVAFALLTAAEREEQLREQQSSNLIWTGPESKVIPLRRTDQALLQLISEAKHKLMIVSFAVYKVKNIMQALIEAAKRGVSVSILVESSDESSGRLTYDAARAMGEEIRKYARFYVWPKEKRPVSPDGKHGNLHAKAAVADGRTLYVTSANLTDYAMNLNMELGVLIRGGTLPKQVERHFEELIRKRTIVPLEMD